MEHADTIYQYLGYGALAIIIPAIIFIFIADMLALRKIFTGTENKDWIWEDSDESWGDHVFKLSVTIGMVWFFDMPLIIEASFTLLMARLYAVPLAGRMIFGRKTIKLL